MDTTSTSKRITTVALAIGTTVAALSVAAGPAEAKKGEPTIDAAAGTGGDGYHRTYP